MPNRIAHPVCLTFDNGPEPGVTDVVLDVLARRNIKALFFVIGEKLRDPARRKLAERAKAEGHLIGNHTLTHGLEIGKRPLSQALHEIQTTEALLDGLNDKKMFRPNGGGGIISSALLSNEVVDYLKAEGYTAVLWNAVPKDWEPIDDTEWKERALEMCRNSKTTTVLVLHDLRRKAVANLDSFLGQLLDEGATFTQEIPVEVMPLKNGVIVWDSIASVSQPAPPEKAGEGEGARL